MLFNKRNIITPIECCGCSACYNICPKNAISMKENSEGFLYPFIDEEKCVDCGLCKKVFLFLIKQMITSKNQTAMQLWQMMKQEKSVLQVVLLVFWQITF